MKKAMIRLESVDEDTRDIVLEPDQEVLIEPLKPCWFKITIDPGKKESIVIDEVNGSEIAIFMIREVTSKGVVIKNGR
jgi:hypothetical protein